jgi:hypothetical protein
MSRRNLSEKPAFQRIDITLLVPMVILGLIVALFGGFPTPGKMLFNAKIMLVIGFLLLLAAKMSVFRRGIWISWGTKEMKGFWRAIYIAAYALMGFGAIIILAAYRATH